MHLLLLSRIHNTPPEYDVKQCDTSCWRYNSSQPQPYCHLYIVCLTYTFPDGFLEQSKKNIPAVLEV